MVLTEKINRVEAPKTFNHPGFLLWNDEEAFVAKERCNRHEKDGQDIELGNDRHANTLKKVGKPPESKAASPKKPLQQDRKLAETTFPKKSPTIAKKKAGDTPPGISYFSPRPSQPIKSGENPPRMRLSGATT